MSLRPASGTPALAAAGGAVEQVRQLAQCGDMMYAVGTLTTISHGTARYTRDGAFSFDATSPYQVSGWDPKVNGTVNTIAFSAGDCRDAYLGGRFTAIDGVAVKNIAEVSTRTGAVVSSFDSSANGKVDTIVGWHGHLLIGGSFTSINGSAANPYFASLSPRTGDSDGYLRLAISGHYTFTSAAGAAVDVNPTRVYNQQLNHAGNRDLIEGDFTSVGGAPRRQIAMLDLAPTGATTDRWYPTEFNANCSVSQPMYAQAAAWSPNDATVYVASTGNRPATGPGHLASQARAGLCDSASAFPATSGIVHHRWINYTGCNSLFSTAATAGVAFFGGHERWADNSHGCDTAGPGAVAAPGMVGLSAATGAVALNPTRDRGLGADDMLTTAAGLWIASDNLDGSNECGGAPGHAGICLLPYLPE